MKATAPACGPGEIRCPQCWLPRPLGDFRAKKNPLKAVRWCLSCRGRWGNWSTKTPEEKAASGAAGERRKRKGLARAGEYRVSLVMASGNRKTGPIPVSTTERGTCPTACPFFGSGCFADFHMLKVHWDRVPASGMTWAAFCRAVEKIPVGQLWRHNEAGDLPGEGNKIDIWAMAKLVDANRAAGARGFTFTHKPVLPLNIPNRGAIKTANARGFTVNLSANNLGHADTLADLGIGPVAVVLPSTAPDRGNRTPAGRHVVVCPAETAGLTCEQCRLCANGTRKTIVGFRAHGQAKAMVDTIVQLRVPKRRTGVTV